MGGKADGKCIINHSHYGLSNRTEIVFWNQNSQLNIWLWVRIDASWRAYWVKVNDQSKVNGWRWGTSDEESLDIFTLYLNGATLQVAIISVEDVFCLTVWFECICNVLVCTFKGMLRL